MSCAASGRAIHHRMHLRTAAGTALAATLAFPAIAVGSNQSALDPAGEQAARIYGLWWLFVVVAAVVWLVVMVFMLWAAARSRMRSGEGAGASGMAGSSDMARTAPDIAPEPGRERRMTAVVVGAVAVTTIILLVLMISEFVVARSLAGASRADDFVAIAVTGHQWWWEVQYQDAVPSKIVTTANEIHIPVGRPVRLELRSNDVIHSLWVPNLHGKKDLIPGHPTQMWLRADRAGTYSGQCAEFCGHQHANMRITIVAEPQERFDAWLAAQRRPAEPPQTPMQQRGQQVFLGTTCVMCHTINGTPAFGRVGPNLTHVASRQTLAAGAVPNRPGHLAGWIMDPQKIKPGVRMPQHALAPEDLRALLEYIDSLK